MHKWRSVYDPQNGHNINILPEALDEGPGVARVVHDHGPVPGKGIVCCMSKNLGQFLYIIVEVYIYIYIYSLASIESKLNDEV